MGPYDLLRRLGVGATAEVFLATGPPGGSPELVAVKALLPHLAEDAGHCKAFTREARTASLLRHPNIGQIYDVGDDNGRPYIAMELCGWSISALQKKLRPTGERLSIEESCEIVRQAALGLHYAHEVAAEGRSLGLVHRDVSPQNLMLTQDAQVKVVDFGLAKATNAQVTQTTGIKGKLPYMPPEQLKALAVDRRVDVFALGAVLWELVTGVMLYPGPSEADIFQQALFLPQPHPDEVVRGLPRAVVDVLIRTVERDLNKRTPTAAALAELLAPLTAPDARSKIAARLLGAFEPLPRTAGEALGLPETPKPLASTPARGARPALRPPVPLENQAPTTRERRLRTVSDPGPARPRRADASPSDTILDDDHASSTTHDDEDIDPTHSMVKYEGKRGRRTLLVAAGAVIALLAVSAGVFGVSRIARGGTAGGEPEPLKLTTAPEEPSATAVAKQHAPAAQKSQPARPPPLAKGTLVLRSNVPAFVDEKGARLGMTPLQAQLSAGKHLLVVSTADGKISNQVDVIVPAGATLTKDVTLH